nr:MAG TPA: hypothetical protein [Caudoviricetes sp.]
MPSSASTQKSIYFTLAYFRTSIATIQPCG